MTTPAHTEWAALRCQTSRWLGTGGDRAKLKRPVCPNPRAPNSVYCAECMAAAMARIQAAKR